MNPINREDCHFYPQIINCRVKSGNFGQRVNSDIRLQTVNIKIRRLIKSRLIRIFTVCLVNLNFIPIIQKQKKQGPCPNLADCRNLPDITLKDKCNCTPSLVTVEPPLVLVSMFCSFVLIQRITITMTAGKVLDLTLEKCCCNRKVIVRNAGAIGK